MGNKRPKGKKNVDKGAKKPSKSTFSLILAFGAGCILCSSLFLLLGSIKPQTNPVHLTLDQLLNMPEEELAETDIARTNLICAKGLTGTENLDIEKCISTINTWTELIKTDTINRLAYYYQNPAKYDDSINKFKVVNMVLYLKDKLGVHYDPACVGNEDFSNPGYIFIHGLLTNKHSGTCTSIPTLCVAIGRRLGYPLKLVLTKHHVFFRWDGKDERFNIEACCIGVDAPSDDHFKTGKYALTEADLLHDHYLKSLTPKEELALFIGSRSACLWDTDRRSEALIACSWENHLSPDYTPCLMMILAMANRNLNQVAQKEYEITGKPARYMTDLPTENGDQPFIWKQTIKSTRPKSINDLVKNAQQNRKQNNPLYYDPVAPTLSPQRPQRQ